MSTPDQNYDYPNLFMAFPQVAAGERRDSMRFSKEPGTDFAVILHPQEAEGTVEVADESLGGLAIVVDEPVMFSVGQDVELMYAGGYLKANVRHVTRRPDGRYTVGFKC